MAINTPTQADVLLAEAKTAFHAYKAVDREYAKRRATIAEVIAAFDAYRAISQQYAACRAQSR